MTTVAYTAQARRSVPDAKACDLYPPPWNAIHEHPARQFPAPLQFIEHLGIEGAEECEWIMMGIII